MSEKGEYEEDDSESRLDSRDEVRPDPYSLFAFSVCLGNYDSRGIIPREPLGHPAER